MKDTHEDRASVAPVTVKRLVNLIWTPETPPNDSCHYHHTEAVTPFGKFILTWKGWKTYPDYGFDETPWDGIEYHGWNSVAEAQAWAAEEMAKRIDLCFEQG